MIVIKSVEVVEVRGTHCRIITEKRHAACKFSRDPTPFNAADLPTYEDIHGHHFISGRRASRGEDPHFWMGFSSQASEQLEVLLDCVFYPALEMKALREYAARVEKELEAQREMRSEDAATIEAQNKTIAAGEKLISALQECLKESQESAETCSREAFFNLGRVHALEDQVRDASLLPFWKRFLFLLGCPLRKLIAPKTDHATEPNNATETDAAPAPGSGD